MTGNRPAKQTQDAAAKRSGKFSSKKLNFIQLYFVFALTYVSIRYKILTFAVQKRKKS